MKSFSIDRDNNITAFTKRKDAESANGDTFRSEKELTELTARQAAIRSRREPPEASFPEAAGFTGGVSSPRPVPV